MSTHCFTDGSKRIDGVCLVTLGTNEIAGERVLRGDSIHIQQKYLQSYFVVTLYSKGNIGSSGWLYAQIPINKQTKESKKKSIYTLLTLSVYCKIYIFS